MDVPEAGERSSGMPAIRMSGSPMSMPAINAVEGEEAAAAGLSEWQPDAPPNAHATSHAAPSGRTHTSSMTKKAALMRCSIMPR